MGHGAQSSLSPDAELLAMTTHTFPNNDEKINFVFNCILDMGSILRPKMLFLSGELLFVFLFDTHHACTPQRLV